MPRSARRVFRLSRSLFTVGASLPHRVPTRTNYLLGLTYQGQRQPSDRLPRPVLAPVALFASTRPWPLAASVEHDQRLPRGERISTRRWPSEPSRRQIQPLGHRTGWCGSARYWLIRPEQHSPGPGPAECAGGALLRNGDAAAGHPADEPDDYGSRRQRRLYRYTGNPPIADQLRDRQQRLLR